MCGGNGPDVVCAKAELIEAEDSPPDHADMDLEVPDDSAAHKNPHRALLRRTRDGKLIMEFREVKSRIER